MRGVLLFAVAAMAAACGGSTTSESSRSGAWIVEEEPAPTEAAPEADPEPAPPEAETVPVEYQIDSGAVDEATFMARHQALEIDDEPFVQADLVNEDDSYGGSEASYHARDPATGEAWTYTEIDFVSSRRRQSRRLVLSRDRAAESDASEEDAEGAAPAPVGPRRL